jgi:hypothetical protein
MVKKRGSYRKPTKAFRYRYFIERADRSKYFFYTKRQANKFVKNAREVHGEKFKGSIKKI